MAAFVAILAVAGLYFAFADDTDEVADNPPPPTTMAPDGETMTDIEIIEAGVEALYSGDVEQAVELFELQDGDHDQIRQEAAYMNARSEGLFAITLIFALTACGSGAVPATTTPPTTQHYSSPTDGIQNIWDLPQLAPVDPGTYFMDPDLDPSTPLRVVYEVPAEGWSQWVGAVKFEDEGHVAVSITTVTNLVSDGCRDHSHADPPVGPTVDDLATALADLAPFQVTSPPRDVTVYGYHGKHLELTVPDLLVEGSGDDRRFTECNGGQLKSWVAPFDTTPGDAFYGYTDSGYTEEFWILDVEGTRLMIAAEGSAGSPQEDLEELRAILDSIRIEP